MNWPFLIIVCAIGKIKAASFHLGKTWWVRVFGLFFVLATVALVGCGGDDSTREPIAAKPAKVDGRNPAPTKDESKSDLSEPYAYLDRNKNQFIGSGMATWGAQQEALKNIPVVVTQWASWCVSCAAEAPILAKAAEEYRGQVAFIGINALDKRSAAEEFLALNYMGMAQIDDPDGEIVDEISNVGRSGLPRTTFITRLGAPVFTNIGSYTNYEQLRADIDEYLTPATTANER